MTEASLKKKWETPFKPQPPLYVQLLVDNRLWMFEANKPKIKHVRPHVIESFCMSLCVCVWSGKAFGYSGSGGRGRSENIKLCLPLKFFRWNFIWSTIFYRPLSGAIFISSTAARLHPRRGPAVSVRCTARRWAEPLHQELHEIRDSAVGSGHDLLVQLYPHRVGISRGAAAEWRIGWERERQGGGINYDCCISLFNRI